ncbi:MAG: hypothetical protein ACLT4C_02205 [Butyricicoccus sp.]
MQTVSGRLIEYNFPATGEAEGVFTVGWRTANEDATFGLRCSATLAAARHDQIRA